MITLRRIRPSLPLLLLAAGATATGALGIWSASKDRVRAAKECQSNVRRFYNASSCYGLRNAKFSTRLSDYIPEDGGGKLSTTCPLDGREYRLRTWSEPPAGQNPGDILLALVCPNSASHIQVYGKSEDYQFMIREG